MQDMQPISCNFPQLDMTYRKGEIKLREALLLVRTVPESAGNAWPARTGTPLWWFAGPYHIIDALIYGPANQNHTRDYNFQCPFESDVRMEYAAK